MMTRLARFAIDANFGRMRRAKHKPEFEVHDHVPHLLGDNGEMPEGIPQIAYMGIPADGPAVG